MPITEEQITAELGRLILLIHPESDLEGLWAKEAPPKDVTFFAGFRDDSTEFRFTLAELMGPMASLTDKLEKVAKRLAP